MDGDAIIPLNDLVRHVAPLRDALRAVAAEVIDGGHYVLGPGVHAFEVDFAAYCGVAHCIGVGNGSDALELALRAAGIGDGDGVLLAANAAMYATGAVIACNAIPLFVDVLDDAATIDPAAVQATLDAADSAGTPPPRALIATHLYGRLARMDALLPICRARGITVLEDCAQAHGARDAHGTLAGGFGDVAAFSFYPTKNLGALGDGGAVLANDPGIAARTAQLRQYGWAGKYVNALPGGRNSRLDEVQARMLTVMLPRLDAWNERRREIADRYSRLIVHADITVPAVTGADYVAHLYVVHSTRRNALRAHLAAAGVHSDVHYPLPDHHQPCHAGRFDHVRLPVTERHAHTALTLPCFPELHDDEVATVIDACNRF